MVLNDTTLAGHYVYLDRDEIEAMLVELYGFRIDSWSIRKELMKIYRRSTIRQQKLELEYLSAQRQKYNNFSNFVESESLDLESDLDDYD